MARDRVRFGVDLDRETDAQIQKIAKDVEDRSKRNFHAVLCRRLVKIYRENPEPLRQLGLIR